MSMAQPWTVASAVEEHGPPFDERASASFMSCHARTVGLSR